MHKGQVSCVINVLITDTTVKVAAYVPAPAVIWLSREPKRQTTDHAVGTHYLNRSVTQPRLSDNSNAN